MKIVLNSSIIIALDKVSKLDILKYIFDEIYIPRAVYYEVAKRHKIPEWIKVADIKNEAFLQILRDKLGKGESEAIILALEIKADLVGLDDLNARKIAKKLGINVIGTVGIILLAKKKGIIKELKPVLEKLRKKGFYLDEELINKVLKETGEI